jgi:hypothetical protein
VPKPKEGIVITLICWDGRTVAADGLYSYDILRASASLPKLRRKDGFVFALTGTTALYDPMVEWFLGDRNPDNLPKVSSDHMDTRLLVFKDGLCESYKLNLPYPEPCFAPDAWGICAEYALGCMDEGADAARAVERSIVRCKELGGPVQVIDLESLKAEIAA